MKNCNCNKNKKYIGNKNNINTYVNNKNKTNINQNTKQSQHNYEINKNPVSQRDFARNRYVKRYAKNQSRNYINTKNDKQTKNNYIKDYVTWKSIHELAKNATNQYLIDQFIQYMKYLQNNFPCAKCRPHIKQYLIDHPMKNYINRDKGIFIWSWEFHNSVNKRLNKPIISFSNVLKQYYH